MTLRAWAFLLIVALYFLITAGANAQSNRSVWEQMQARPNGTASGVIKALELNGDIVLVEVRTIDGLKKLTLCSDPAQIPFDRPREDKLNLIRDAYKSGEVVELGIRGPWSPCFNTIRVSKGA